MALLPKVKSLADTRWYLYRSAMKIRMLYDQLAAGSSTSKAAKVGVSAKGMSFEAEGSSEPQELTLDDKLEVVEKAMRDEGRIGGLENPGEYVEGVVPMRWGLFDDHGDRKSDEPPFVFFGGFVREVPLVVGLGGSSMHIQGYSGATSTHSRSHTGTVVRWLSAAAGAGERPDLPDWWDMEAEEAKLFQGTAIALGLLRPPTQNLRFLARTLAVGKTWNAGSYVGVADPRVVVGAPIWVATETVLSDPDRLGLDEEWRTFDKDDKGPRT